MVIKYREQSEDKIPSSKVEKIQFTFSDMIAGYVTSVEKGFLKNWGGS